VLGEVIPSLISTIFGVERMMLLASAKAGNIHAHNKDNNKQIFTLLA